MTAGRFRLVPLTGTLAGRARPLEAGEELVLGRDPRAAHLVFGTDDRLVSRRHAAVREHDGIVVVRDLESSTGTFVDGESIEEAELQPGDVFELGRGGPRIRVELGDGGTLVVPGPAVARDTPTHPLRVLEPAAPLPPGAQLRLTVDSGSRRGESIDAGGRVLRLGRAPANTVAFPDEPAVSAQHAKIVRLEDGFVVVDLESTNGTFVNGRRIRRAHLRRGDRIALGPGGPELLVTIEAGTAGGGTVVIPSFAGLAARSGSATLIGEQDLPAEGLVLGRGETAGLRLDSPIVSLGHARLRAEGAGAVVEDLGSTNGTYVNGRRVTRHKIEAGDLVVVGPFRLEVEGTRVKVYDTRRRAELRARGLAVRAAGRALIEGVSVTLAPGSFTAIIGPSGSGKSTLLRALCAARPADAGRVEVNGTDLYASPAALAGLVGYVPQDDVVHPELTPGECLDYTARLRLPGDMSGGERQRRLAEVLATLELTERRDVPIHRLSGGQRKRVSIGVELLTEPDLLFLDEPTSGLDPGLEESLMLLLRELSYKGKTIAIVTHTLDHISFCDALVVLAAGRVVFAGAPREALARFDISHAAQLYARLKERSDEEWVAASAEAPPAGEAEPRAAVPPMPARPKGPGGQLRTLVRRYFKTMTRDTRNAALLLAQAPLVAILIGLSMLYGASDVAATKPKNTLLFLLALTSVWFGCSNAARELVKERALYVREKMAGLRALPYVASKIAVLTGLAFLQCLASLLILDLWFGLPGPKPLLLLGMVASAVVGALLGLVVSSVARTADRAMTLLPIVLIPQVLFTFPSVQLDMKGPAGLVARVMPTWWSFDLLRRLALQPDENATHEALEARLAEGGGALMTKARFEKMLQEGYPMWNYRSSVEITWTASTPERWAAALPAGLGRGRTLAVDALALGAFAALLLAVAVRTESKRRD